MAALLNKTEENQKLSASKKDENYKLGEILVSNSLIARKDLETAAKKESLPARPLIKVLIDDGKIKENDLSEFLAKYFFLNQVDINDIEIPKNIVNIIPPEKAIKSRAVPYKIENNTLYIAAADPTRNDIIDEISFITGIPAVYSVAPYSQIITAMSKYYNASFFLEKFKSIENAVKTDQESSDVSDISKDKDSASAVEKYVNKVIGDAVERGASDIHIEFYRKFSRIRFRIDGKLSEYSNTPPTAKLNIIARIKNMAKLDITEQRFPQDGRITVSLGAHEIDIRVSCIPTLFGEKIVMRILNKSSLVFDINKIGFSKSHLNLLGECIHKPFGMILVTGPTGSGKTTSLYCILNDLNNESLNISTAEDPIEYDFPGINQVQVNEKLKNEKTNVYFNFAETLRSFLRQDPDIIMVGEIRDNETASISIQAALTGHLVLSTLHTNNAASTITRLVNMKIEPFLIASSLTLVIAQRLIRKLCLECKEELPLETLKKIGIAEEKHDIYIKLYKAKGCPACNKSGYKGRIPIYEMLYVSENIKELINNSAAESELERAAISQGMKTLSDSAKEKFFTGITSLEEILPYLNVKTSV